MLAAGPPGQILGLSPPHTDFVGHMIGMIFGPIWHDIEKHGLNLQGLGSFPQGPLGAGFFVLNTAVFTFITFYVVKVIFEGVAGTAYHGEWLGKRFHTFWTPMRMIVMLAMIAPVAGGYDLAQVIVLWTGSNAISLADKVAEKVMPVVAKQGAVYTDPLAPSAKKIASNMFLDYVCMDALNDRSLTGSGPIIRVQATGNRKWTVYNFSGTGDGLPLQTCGSIQLRTPPTQVALAESTGMNAMMSYIQPAAKQFEKIVASESKNPKVMPKNLVTDGAKAYTHSVMKAVRKYAREKNKTMVHGWDQEVKKDGFAVLGDYMAQIAGYDGKIGKLANVQPIITPPLHEKPIGLSGYGARDILAAARAYVHARNPGLSNPTGLPANIPKSQTKGKGWLKKKLRKLVNGENEFIAAFNKLGSATDPLGAIQGFGVHIAAIATDLIALVALIGGLASIVAVPAVLAVFGLLFPLLMVGDILGYIIPMVPYLVYFMAVVGWVAALVTAVVGAPVWAAAHVLPDSTEGLVPEAGKHGYKLLLSLFTKPALIVFGYIAALGVFDAGAWLANNTFLFVSKSVLGGTTTNGALGAILSSFSGMVALGVVVVVLYWKLADWSFGLIHSLPDRALEWGGLSDISMSEEGTHNTVIAAAMVAPRHAQAPAEHGLRLTNKNERGKGAGPKLPPPGQADKADGEPGDE